MSLPWDARADGTDQTVSFRTSQTTATAGTCSNSLPWAILPSSYDRCVPFAIVVVLALLLGAAAFAFEDGGEEPPAPLRPASLERIVASVERERGLEFERVPRPAVVTPGQARSEGLESIDQDYPPARRRADEQMLAMLGLVPEGTDLKDAYATSLGELVAGYYDPRKDRLRIVSGAQTENRVLYEMVMAHELTHVLEDQVYDFDLDVLAAGGDRALALTALIEGTASVLMVDYAAGRFGQEELLAGVAASAFQDTGDLPPFLTAQLVWPYTAGEAFVGRLLRVGGGEWRLVDAAMRFRPPQSTEQILHPGKYLRLEEPRRVSLRGPVRALGDGLAAAGALDVRRVADAEAARARRRDGLGGRRRRLGRRLVRAAGPRRRARARDALGLGHPARRGGVRRGAGGVGRRRPAGVDRCVDRPRGRSGHARAHARLASACAGR